MKNDFNQDILDIIQNENDFKSLRERLERFHPYDLANALKDIEPKTRMKVYASLNDKELADIFSYLEDDEKADLFMELDLRQGASIIENMEIDDAVDLIQEIDTDEVSDYLGLLNEETRENISYLAKEHLATVGSIMTTNFIEIPSNYDVKEAMKTLIKKANETEVIDPLYITEAGHLIGILDLKTLIIARSPMQVRNLMKTNFIYVDKSVEVEDAAGIIRDYSLSALPVLERGRLVGIITIDDAIDVIEDEVSAQYSHLAAITSDIDEDLNIFVSLKKRLPWLIGLLILSFVTSSVIGRFDDIIKQMTILIFFQSLILDMVGNVGTQTLAITIRGLSRGDLDHQREVKTYLRQEFKISIINSLILAITTFIVVYLFLLINNYQNPLWVISFILAISMLLSLNFASFMGIITPIMLDKLGFDPTIASGPLITTLSDVVAVLIYYGLATLFINLL